MHTTTGVLDYLSRTGIIILAFIAGLIFIHQTVLRIIRKIHHFPIPSFMTRLIDNPVRRAFIQNPERIAERLQLSPGMIVVEIGPGRGSYTKSAAKRILPGGVVYAVDIQEGVIQNLQERIKKERVSNIIPLIDDVYNLSFEDKSVDRVFAVACVPEIPDPVRALKECARILKSDGILSLCELLPDPDYPLRSTEIGWARQAGLKLKDRYGNWFTYQLNFVKQSP